MLDLSDFSLQEQPEDNFGSLFLGHGIMAHIPWPLIETIKSLQLHYTMIQFLINEIITIILATVTIKSKLLCNLYNRLASIALHNREGISDFSCKAVKSPRSMNSIEARF